MNNSDASTSILKGLKNNQQISQVPMSATSENITMLRCIRWVMKEYGMNIEVKRADVVASTMMSLHLVKYDKNGHLIKTENDISITDHKIEKGLFELEKKIMNHANLQSLHGLDTVLELLRNYTLNLPPHSELRNEILMNGHRIRISYVGLDSRTKKDLFVGCLMQGNNVVASTEPQTRMGYVLDNLESALFTKRREVYRKAIGEHMMKARNSAGFAT